MTRFFIYKFFLSAYYSGMEKIRRVPVSCNRDCISGCPLEAVVEKGKIIRIGNSPYKSPYMNGCARGFLFHKAVYHPERITTPLIRTGERGRGEFRRATWDEALDLVAGQLKRVREKYGPASVMRIGGSGACRGALHHTASLTKRFLACYGGYTDTAGSFSSEATDFVKPFVYGTKYVGLDVKTLLNSEMIILWGFNAADTRFGPETEAVLAELRRRGVPMVVVDPRRTRTVTRYEAEWLPVYPGSDGALMLALLYVFLERGLEKGDFIERYSLGFSQLRDYVLGADGSEPKTPEWASSRCGLSPDTIVDFALRYAAAKPAALLQGLSVQRTVGGEEVDRLGGVLQLALGNVGVPGGSTGSGQWNVIPGPRCGKLPVPENPVKSSVPVYQWADAALGGRQAGWPADTKLLYNVGGNYLIQGSDVRKNIRAFQQAEFVVSHDYFHSDTVRYSDVVLPATTFVERNDILFSHTNYLYYSKQAIPPLGEARDDYDIFGALAQRLGFYQEFSEGRTSEEWLDLFLERSEVEDISAFKSTGIYKGDDQARIGLSGFIQDPVAHPLATESGKIEIACPSYAKAGGPLIPRYQELEQDGSFPFFLVTPHERMRNNSQFDNIEAFRRQIDESVWMHPADAAARGIGSGEEAAIYNQLGAVFAKVHVSDKIKQGVLSYSQGRWLDGNRPHDTGQINANLVTSTTPSYPSRGARTHSVKVNICKKAEFISLTE